MYTAISLELAKIQRSLRLNHSLEIKSYPSIAVAQRFNSLHIISDIAQKIGRAKTAVEKLLNGNDKKRPRHHLERAVFETGENGILK